MLVTMKRKDFKSLEDISLIWACIEPTIQQVRGRNFAVKSEVYATLNRGQRALLLFQMLYGHTATGVDEFYTHMFYLLSNEGVWSQLRKGMQYFGAYDMEQLIEQMEMVFQSRHSGELDKSAEQQKVLFTEDDITAEMSSTSSLLNKTFRDLLPMTIKLVATYIRDNESEYVELID